MKLLLGFFEDDLDPFSKKKQLIGNHERIIFVGNQNDIRPFFAISNSLVFPSYREGFPNVVMQAGAIGLPSVVTDIYVSNEIIQYDYNDIIVPSKDKEALKMAMYGIFIDKDLYVRYSSKSTLEIVNNFKQQFYWRALIGEYKSYYKI
jgi:glycosyltransferase involved in cell wall biosynthesis